MNHVVIVSTNTFPDGSAIGASWLGRSTLLEYQISMLKSYGITEINLITGDWNPPGLHVRSAPKTSLVKQLDFIVRSRWDKDLLIVDGSALFRGPHLGHVLGYPVEAFITSRQAKSREERGVRVLTGSCGRVQDLGRDIELAFPWEIWSGLFRVNARACGALGAMLRNIDDATDLEGIVGLFAKSYRLYSFYFEAGWMRLEDPADLPKVQEFTRSGSPLGAG